MSETTAPLDKLSIVVYSGHYDKVHYALVLAAAAAAVSRPVTLFFTMGACHALKRHDSDGNPAWRAMRLSEDDKAGEAANGGDRDDDFKAMNVATFEELLQSCVQLDVTFMVCEMGLRAEGLEGHPLRDDIPLTEGGAVTFLHDTSKDGSVIFI